MSSSHNALEDGLVPIHSVGYWLHHWFWSSTPATSLTSCFPLVEGLPSWFTRVALLRPSEWTFPSPLSLTTVLLQLVPVGASLHPVLDQVPGFFTEDGRSQPGRHMLHVSPPPRPCQWGGMTWQFQLLHSSRLVDGEAWHGGEALETSFITCTFQNFGEEKRGEEHFGSLLSQFGGDCLAALELSYFGASLIVNLEREQSSSYSGWFPTLVGFQSMYFPHLLVVINSMNLV
eukprot:Gb_07770 [translate_table: standard]